MTFIPTITLFCSMKAFAGHNAVIQHNALANWRAFDLSVILCGNDPGTAEAAKEYGFLHIPDITVSEYGTPLLSDMFTKVQAQARTPYVCYINGDILLPHDFVGQVQRAGERFSTFMLIGERWDVEVTEPLPANTSCDTAGVLRKYGGVRHPPTGIDYFAFPTGMIDYMPKFRIGRPGWDIWLLWETKRRGIPVVDASAVLTVLHQKHDYKHVPGGDGYGWANSPEGVQQFDMLKMYPGLKFASNTVLHATYRLCRTGFRSGLSLRRLAWDAHCLFVRAWKKGMGLLNAI